MKEDFLNIRPMFEDAFGPMPEIKPIEYPINFPRTIGERQCRTPKELQEEMNEFFVRWGFTEFEFNGNKITIHNDKFNYARTQTGNRICDTYNNKNYKNFD